MRKREEIWRMSRAVGQSSFDDIILEVLLDIRELLISINQK